MNTSTTSKNSATESGDHGLHYYERWDSSNNLDYMVIPYGNRYRDLYHRSTDDRSGPIQPSESR